MKLNPDCLRDIMLLVEDRISVETAIENPNGLRKFSYVSIPCLVRLLPDSYSKEEIIYHVVQLSESGYLKTDFSFAASEMFGYFYLNTIYHITPKGHDFIANIGGKESWAKTSAVLKSLKSISLSVIETVAKGITSAIVDQYIAGFQA